MTMTMTIVQLKIVYHRHNIIFVFWTIEQLLHGSLLYNTHLILKALFNNVFTLKKSELHVSRLPTC